MNNDKMSLYIQKVAMFVGREFELEQLKIFFERRISGLAVCCGRRRIGKSTLIEYASTGWNFVEFYGLPPREGVRNCSTFCGQ